MTRSGKMMTLKSESPCKPASGNRIGVAVMSSAGALILGLTVGLWTDDGNPYSVVYQTDAVAPVRAVRAVHRRDHVDHCPGTPDKARYQRPLRPRV